MKLNVMSAAITQQLEDLFNMASILPFGLCLLLLVSCSQGSDLSKEEELDLDQQLNLLNKPAVKTITTQHGDIYDCVDFYKQPAFDHPLLKDHNFHPEMRPNYVKPTETEPDPKRSPEGVSSVKLKGVGCPRGTVPIRRTTKEDLIRQNQFTEVYESNIHPLSKQEPGLHYAGARIHFHEKDPKFGGGEAHLSIYNPPHVRKLQFSSGLIKVSNGSDFIKAGWMVNPLLYGDNRTRLFTAFRAGDKRCFNTKCPGFVQMDPEIPLGYVFPEVSSPGIKSVEQKFLIFRDHIHNWWLVLGDDNKYIGYWPSTLFRDLRYPADDVFWGGEIFSLPHIQSPPMGNGIRMVNWDPKLYAYCRRIGMVDDDKYQLYYPVLETQLVSDIGWSYCRMNFFGVTKYWGRTIMFGGPGAVFGD